jgi:hypothetical protein
VDGSTLASFINPAVVVEGTHTNLFMGNYLALAGSTTKIFANTLAPAGQLTAFNINKIDIRNNGAQPCWIGWVTGTAVTGAAISAVHTDGEASASVAITSNAHGLVAGDRIIIQGRPASATVSNLTAQGEFVVMEAVTVGDRTNKFRIATVAAPTTAIAYSSGDAGTTGAYWYKGYDKGIPAVQNDTGTPVRKGICLESSSIPNDFVRIPISNVAALFIYNSSAATALTNTDGYNVAYLWA